MTDPDARFLQGTVDMLILKALHLGPRHGYDVARWIRERSDEALKIEEGALYTALHRMKARGWLQAEWGLSENNRKAKYYRLTKEGEQELHRSAKSWKAYAQAVVQVLGVEGPAASPA